MTSEPIPVLGGMFQMYMHELNDNTISRVIGQTGQWEPETTKIVQEDLKLNQTFIDAGANIGWYTLLASKIVGESGRVYAFEPWVTNFGILLKNIQLNHCRNVVAINAPLWDTPNVEMTLQVGSDNLGDIDVLPSKPEDPPSVHCISQTLDGLFGPDSVDMIKVDTQTSDSRVLMGGQNLFTQSSKQIRLITETPAGTPEKLGFRYIRATSDYNYYYVKEAVSK